MKKAVPFGEWRVNEYVKGISGGFFINLALTYNYKEKLINMTASS